MRRTIGMAAVVFALVPGGCDGSDNDWPDTGVVPDYGYEVSDDAGSDVPPDVPAETPTDTAGCEYPAGPYGFRAEGDTVPAMAWPSAVLGGDETLPADFEALFCDPAVKSIFIQVTTTVCPVCPERIREIAALKDHWEATGAKWIFVVQDASSASQAQGYVNRYGVTFGYRTHDGDNTAGANLISSTGLFSAVPWTSVIRASDMQLVHEEPDDRYLDIEAIATELSTTR